MSLLLKVLAIYVRTSTDKQDTGLEAQVMACKDYCAREGITDYVIFSDDDESGSKEHRPAFDAMLAAIERGEIDRVLVYCSNRLTRDAIQALLLVVRFKAQGVRILSCTETFDLESPEGRLLYAILACFAQFQREDTVRKVKNGLENAKRKGKKLGPKQRRVDAPILELLDNGYKVASVARKLGVTRGAVYRAMKARKAA